MIELSPYVIIGLFSVGGLIGVGMPLLLAKMIRPSRPNPEKLTTYECGEDPTGTAWGKFNIRFYVIALIFVLFETELVFLFPWAIVFGDQELNHLSQGVWSKLVFAEMVVFIFVLALGLAYVWGKGFLEWEKPNPKISSFRSPVPNDLYVQLNEKYMPNHKVSTNISSIPMTNN